MSGIGKLPDKERRRQRRRNHVAKDLSDVKYHQRVVPSKKKKNKNKDVDEYFQEDDTEYR